VYAYLSKESPEFPELVCLNKHQHDFCFVLNFEFPKILMKICMVLEGETRPKILGAMVSCSKVMFNVLFT
jgi:hypothetical protein